LVVQINLVIKILFFVCHLNTCVIMKATLWYRLHNLF